MTEEREYINSVKIPERKRSSRILRLIRTLKKRKVYVECSVV
jgi:hypothetical protein